MAAVIREHLTEMVPLHESDEYLTIEEIALFRVLYRFENCHSPGKPSYPQPETWGTVAQYLGVMVPLYSIEATLHNGELDKQITAPNLVLPCLGTLNNMEDY